MGQSPWGCKEWDMTERLTLFATCVSVRGLVTGHGHPSRGRKKWSIKTYRRK